MTDKTPAFNWEDARKIAAVARYRADPADVVDCLSGALDEIEKLEEVLRARASRYREALEWYADTNHIYLLDSMSSFRDQLSTHSFVSHIFLKEVETGQRARMALAEEKEEVDEHDIKYTEVELDSLHPDIETAAAKAKEKP